MSAVRPSFLEQQTLVVELGRESIRMALAETAGDAVRFHGMTEITLEGVDVYECEDAERQLVVDCLRLETRRHGWGGRRAACLLSGDATSTQSFAFPDMPAADLRRAIRLKLADTLHFDVDEACFDARRLEESGAAVGAPRATLVAVAREASVRRAVDMLRRAGLRPFAVGAAAESLANLSQCTSLWDSEEASVHVHVGAHSSIINLFEGRRLRFSREIETAEASFLEALKRPVLTASGALELDVEQARDVLEACGCPVDGEDRRLPHDVRSSEVLPLVEPVAQRLASELERSADYLCSLLGRERVDHVELSGPGGRIRGFDRWLQEHLGVPVRSTDPVERARSHWRLAVCGEEPGDLASFAPILGFSLGNRQPIDLMPREERLVERFGQISRLRRNVVLPVAAASAGLALVGLPALETYDASASLLEQTEAQLDARIREVEQGLLQSRRAWRELGELRVARGLRPDWEGVFKELAALVPGQARVDSLAVEWIEGRPVLQLSASVDPELQSTEAVSTVLTAGLAGSPFFADVDRVEASLPVAGQGLRFEASLGILAPGPQPVEEP